ncbi:DNA-processing protein DprA [Sporolactobacillus shoreicorticis]|uniref:DNA-processing protein DprA n=1 Tax=Sporolactobacillus shoreicorticis TaxID=1923877 RepID=A0ABW5S8V2_9BACL|nr:DNA-processing protein DprA [Sporolactobacillus shoreicorticis]MCO7126007.1 DNA-processing protein DprA [Sporolactobacillus shoreicorticis]
MDSLTLKLVLLNHCRGIGRRTVWQMIRMDPDLSDIQAYSLTELQTLFRLSSSMAKLFMDDRRAIDSMKLLDIYHDEQITPIPFHHPLYPPLLKNVYDPPYLIYGKGKLSLLNEKKMISIVGTRHPSSEAGRITKQIIEPLNRNGWTIVSGMAMGIDGMAHRFALEGRTIAVLGSGLQRPYPRQHCGLYRQLCNAQLVISEYPPPAPPERWRFPERNRIISGMSLGTLVIEAQERSGSLITADQALEQGREVFAIPGSILNATSSGTNRLIQQGAKLVCDWQDIVHELNWDQ